MKLKEPVTLPPLDDDHTVFESESEAKHEWRFRDIAQGSNRLARLLRELKIRRGNRIDIYLPSRPETILALIATIQ